MKLQPILTSLLENDMYKFSMGQAIFHQHGRKHTSWAFKCRNKDVKFTPEMVEEIQEQVNHYCKLRFTEEELQYLLRYEWLHEDYADFLRFWHPRTHEIEIKAEGPSGLQIRTTGSAVNTSPYETPILAIVSEVFYRMGGAGKPYEELLEEYKLDIINKINQIKDQTYQIGTFSEFGFRRRLSAEAQDFVVSQLHNLQVPGFIGTSNVYLAKKHNVRAMGTMAHEWIMLVGQGYHEQNPAYSNKFALDSWIKEYGILNGIVLTDTITTDCFLLDFRRTFATLFSGVRHDSGDPVQWGEKMIRHYKSLGIDPTTKTLLFSDSLNLEKAHMIRKHFLGQAKVSFGIGGCFSSSRTVPLNIVMKTIDVDGQPVAKISDVEGKGMCEDEQYVNYLRRTIDWRLQHPITKY